MMALQRVVGDRSRRYDRVHPARVLHPRPVDQGHRPRPARLPQHGAEGRKLESHHLRLRARIAAAAQAGAMAGRPRPDTGHERQQAGARVATLIRVFEKGRLRRCAPLRQGLEARAHGRHGTDLRAALLYAGRRLQIRLELRDRADRRRDHDGLSRPRPALPLAHAVRARLPAREPGDDLRRP